MAINPYGFKDNATGIVLIVRAESRRQAQTLFNEYIDSLNVLPISDLQIIKEILPGTLREEGFDIDGIVNGGERIQIFEDLLVAPKALFINNAQNSYASTPSASGNTPSGAFTFIVNVRSNNWEVGTFQTFLSKNTDGEDSTTQSYIFRENTNPSRFVSFLTDNTGGTGAALFDEFSADEIDQALWFRMTWDGSTTIDKYISTDIPSTLYEEVNWVLLSSHTITSFTINAGTNTVSVGARLRTDGVPENILDGLIYRVLLINGTDPTAGPEMDMNPNDYESGSFWISSTTAEKWTLNGDAVVAPYLTS
ncbi:MAG: hypothetical protein IH795_02610 [Bacteroidetes bacterium]|nr:hypothetical protein [Bacteroidota bacterium]